MAVSALFCVTLLLSVALGAMVVDYWASDAAGRGLTRAYSALACIAVWALLGVLLLLCGARGWMAVYLCAGAAQWMALSTLTSMNQQDAGEGWLRAAVVCGPLLALALGAALMWKPGVVAVPGVALALLCVTPFLVRAPRRVIQMEPAPTLPEQANLEQLLQLTEGEGMFTTTLPEQARARIRAMEDRQEKLEALLAAGSNTVLVQVNCLDLKVTPALCQAARRRLAAIAEDWRGGEKWDPTPDHLLDPVDFLHRHGCRCEAELSELRKRISSYRDMTIRGIFERRLDEILKPEVK